MKLKTKPCQAKRIHHLVRRYCANCDDDNCLLLDDGETHKCVQLNSVYNIYCTYFRDCVLPADKKLHEKILKLN